MLIADPETVAAAPRLCPLEVALAYRNDAVIRVFRKRYLMSFADAEDLFLETKRWLWLCAKVRHEAAVDPSGAPRTLVMVRDLFLIDEMWHTFILSTADYAEFCERHFGYFLGHQPLAEEGQEESSWDRTRPAELEGKYRALYEIVHDELGKEILIKWFDQYPRKFTLKHIRPAQVLTTR